MTGITRYKEAVQMIKTAILQSRYRAARAANAEQLKLYFNIGRYVSANTRTGKWGTGAIEEISSQLQAELPGLRGFSPSSIKYMRQFFEVWNEEFQADSNFAMKGSQLLADESLEADGDQSIRQLPIGELTAADMNAFWGIGFTHHIQIFSSCRTQEERWYYIRRCAADFWSVEVLKSHLRADDFHHTGVLSNNFIQTIPDVKRAAKAVRAFKDEYLLDFINVEDAEDESDVDERVLEHALVSEIRKFIQTLGSDFCFISNQHRLIVGEEEAFVDLLFYHRSLRSLVAIELKRGKFKPAYLGQLNYYLSALDAQERHPNENQSIGLLLCKEANQAVVELAIRDFNKPMGVAVYRTKSDIPQPYRTLIPLMDGVREILSADRNKE